MKINTLQNSQPMKQIKKITVKVLDYKLDLSLSVKPQREKELDSIESKFKNGETLDIEELTKLQENDRL